MAKSGPKRRFTDDQLREAIATHGNMTRAAKALGMTTSNISVRLRGEKRAASQKNRIPTQPSTVREGLKFEAHGEYAVLHGYTRTGRTIEAVLAEAKVDQSVWQVVDPSIRKWDSLAKVMGEDGESIVVTELYYVGFRLKRRIPENKHKAYDSLYARLLTAAPKWPKIVRRKTTGDPHMLEVALFDTHFMKLCWEPETGSNWDIKIAYTVYENAVDDLLNAAAPYKIEKILFPIGQDFFNINNRNNTTAGGTPMDVDGRYYKGFDVGVWAVIRAIKKALQVAPVHVPWVGGNHDPEISWHMAREVKATFAHCKDVTVDDSPTKQKIIVYGKNGIMITHGDQEAHRDLPVLMAVKDRRAWAATEYNEVHCGHWHKEKITHFLGADTHGGGVVVRVLPSLSGHDKYHADHGWNHTARAAISFLWGKKPGIVASFNAMARE